MRSLLITVAALLALAAAGCGSGNEESASPESPSRQAPAIEGVTIDGEGISLADFRGRPVFVNVWSSW